MGRGGICLALIVSVSATAHAANLRPGQAANHIGETATVCGTVASAYYARRSRGQPTFLDLGHAYPNEDLAVVIWGDSRARFGTPEALAGHHICVTGPIGVYRGRPQIDLRVRSELSE